MTKQDSLSEQDKLPGIDSFGQDDLRGGPGTNEASNSIQNNELLSYFDALDYDQRASILNNLQEERNATGRSSNKNQLKLCQTTLREALTPFSMNADKECRCLPPSPLPRLNP